LYINTLTQSSDKFYRLEFRIWELLLGVLVMILSSNLKIKHLEKIGLPLMLIPIFYFGDDWINDIEPKLIALIGISLIIFSNIETSMLTRVLSLKIISIIGLSSYSIYLLHQPLFAFSRVILRNFNLNLIRYEIKNVYESINILEFNKFQTNIFDESSNILFSLDVLLFSLTILIGYLSYKYIEKPFVNNNYSLLHFFSFVILLTFMILNPSSALDRNNEAVTADNDCWLKIDIFADNFQPLENCFINNNSKKNLILLGDSSTDALSDTVIQKNLFKSYNVYFIPLVYNNFFIDFNNYINCNSCFLNWIQDNSTTIVVTVELHRYIELNGIYSLDRLSNQNVEIFKENMNYLKKYSQKFLILESFPTVPVHLNSAKDIIRNDRLGVIKEVYIPHSYWIQNTQSTIDTYFELQNNFDINVVRTNDLFCNEETNKCSFYYDKNLLYRDQVHLNISGGQLITERLSTLLEK
jgi:hypothetical protein